MEKHNIEQHPVEQHVIGIDFGTSTSKMAWYDHRKNEVKIIKNKQKEELTPSVVYVEENGNYLVGAPAEAMRQKENGYDRLVIASKREFLKDDTPRYVSSTQKVSIVEVAGQIFKKLKKDAEEWLQAETKAPAQITEAVITCPVTYHEEEQEKILAAARIAQFQQVQLISEPEAVAWACVEDKDLHSGTVLIYGLGGGTFDLAAFAYHPALKQMDPKGEPVGAKHLGGDYFDDELYEYCNKLALKRKEIGREINVKQSNGKDGRDLHFLEECKRCKSALTDNVIYPFNYALKPLPDDPHQQRPTFQYDLQRSEFESAISELVEKTVQMTRGKLKEAREKHYNIQKLILTGGASQVPLVERMLEQVAHQFDLNLVKRWDRERAAAKGAAYYAHIRKLDHTPNGHNHSKAPSRPSASKRAEAEEEYREYLVEIAWFDEVLQPAEMEEIDKRVKQLGLTKHQTDKIETGVMSRDRHAIFNDQTAYRAALTTMKNKGEHGAEVIERLAKIAQERDITPKGARQIEIEALGLEKETFFKKG